MMGWRLAPRLFSRRPERNAELSPSDIGRLGEDLACRFLWRGGFRILERNFEGPRGEIDIVAEKSGRVRFIEVKTRTSDSLGSPEERVDRQKRELLRETARAYLENFRGRAPGGVQFDVLAQVIKANGQIEKQTLLENAL